MKPLIERLTECADLHLSRLRDPKVTEELYARHTMYESSIREAIALLSKPKPTRASPLIPTMEEATIYATEINLPKHEVTKFFNHFESNGWKVGGKAPMKSWKAALRTWRGNWEIDNPEEARSMKRATEPKQSQNPEGWDDWLLGNPMSREAYEANKNYKSARQYLRDEFRNSRK